MVLEMMGKLHFSAKIVTHAKSIPLSSQMAGKTQCSLNKQKRYLHLKKVSLLGK